MKRVARNVAGRGRRWRAVAVAATVGCASVAHADSITDYVHLELGVGVSTYRDQGNGIWYQQGFPYSLSLTAPAVEGGLTGDVLQREHWGVAWHTDYIYLGSVHTNAIATTDANYDAQTQSCRGTCAAQTRFTGHGNVSGVALTLEPHYDWHGFRLGVEGGPFLFLPSWTESLTPATPVPGIGATTVHASARIKVGEVVGVTVAYKHLSVSLEHFFDKDQDVYTPVWSSTNLVMATWRF